jgi:hypothetical protein
VGIVNARSLEFDSDRDQSVKVPHSPSLSLTGSLSLAAWVLPTRRLAHQQGIIEKFTWLGVQARGGYILRLNTPGCLSFSVIPAEGGQPITSTRPVPLDTWSHVAGVYDSKTQISRIYINGVIVHHEPAVPPPVVSDQPLILGADYGPLHFHGRIDEARIYNRALSHEEVRLLAGRPLRSDPMDPNPATPIDLLASMDPIKDAIQGRWMLEGKALLSPATGAQSRIRLRAAPGPEYDLSLTAQRETGTNALGLILPSSNSHFMVVIDGWDGERTSLWMMDNKADNGYNEATWSGKLLPIGKAVALRCAVRRDSVRLWVDGRPAITWEGSPTRVSLNPVWSVPMPGEPALGSNTSRFRITSLEVAPFSRSR